jgi:hypothetical protein
LFFLGALIALLLERRKPKLAKEFTLPVASGVVAGGSLMGVALVFWAMCGRLRVGKGFLHECSIGRSSHVFGLLVRFT